MSKRGLAATMEAESPSLDVDFSHSHGGNTYDKQAVSVATIPPPPHMQLSPIAHIVKGGLAAQGSNSISTAAVVAALGSNNPTCLGKKALKDLTTAESILLLDLVCHPNRIPLGSIKYRITGENLCHVKTAQDLSEIGLNFPRIILCSMTDAIVKYQSDGVPLEIFPSTCSLSSKLALHDFTLSMGSAGASKNSEAATGTTAAGAAAAAVQHTNGVSPASSTATSTAENLISIPEFLCLKQDSPKIAAHAVDPEDGLDGDRGAGRQKRVARANKSEFTAATASPLPAPPAHAPGLCATTRTDKVTFTHCPVSNEIPRSAPASKEEEKESPKKNEVFLARDPSPMDLEVLAAIEQKLCKDGYDIVTRFPASTTGAAIACSHASNGAVKASAAVERSVGETAGAANMKNAMLAEKERECASKPSLVRCLAEIPELEALSAFEFMRELLMIPARQRALAQQSSSAGKAAKTSATTATATTAPHAREYLSENILGAIVSIAKIVLERCPMLPGRAPRAEDVSSVVYDVLSAALAVELPGVLKAEIVYDQIVDIATSHHKSFLPACAASLAVDNDKKDSEKNEKDTKNDNEKNSENEENLEKEEKNHDKKKNSNADQNESQKDTESLVERRRRPSLSHELIGSPRICAILIQMLKEHYAKVDICVITCCAINDVTMQRSGFFREYQDQFHGSGTAEVLIRALFLHKTNGTAIQSICCAIIGLIANNLRNALYFRELGTFEVLVQVLRLHLMDVNVVERILDAMFRVAFIPKSSCFFCSSCCGCSLSCSSPPQQKIAEREKEKERGNGEPHDDELSSSSSLTLTTRVKPIRIKETGACEIVVEVLSLYKTNASIASTASRIIGMISCTAEHAIKFGQVGAIEELLEVLKIYISRENIEKHAASALRNLLEFEENKIKVSKIGACELILKILLLHLNAELVAETLCSVVLFLASHAHNAVKLGENGACLILVELLKEHHTNASIVKQACGALRFIAVSAENQRRLVDHDLFSVLVCVIRTHAHDALIVARVCDALNNIAIIPKNNMVECLSVDGSTKLVPDSPELFVPFVPTHFAKYLMPHITQRAEREDGEPGGVSHRSPFGHALSVKKNQSLISFTEVPPNQCDAVRRSKILHYLQECLVVHANRGKLVKKIRETLLLMSCLG